MWRRLPPAQWLQLHGNTAVWDGAELLSLADRELLLIYNKSDLAEVPAGALAVSAATGRGIDELLTRLDTLVRDRFAAPEASASIVNARQQTILLEALGAIAEVKRSLEQQLDEQMLLVDLQRVASTLALLTGEITRDDIYTEIFSRFCIGK